MTELNRPIRRRSRLPFAHYKRRIVIILEPVDVLAMRLERGRVIYRATLDDVYRQMALWHADAERRRKKAERKLRRFG